MAAADIAAGAGRPGPRWRPGLRWRLTISYLLVTLVAAITMTAATALRQATHGTRSEDRLGPAQVLQKSAAGAAPYLAGPAPDRQAVRFWVAIPVLDELSRVAGGRLRTVAVFDADGRPVTADSCTRAGYTASSAPDCQASAQARVGALLADPAARAAVQSVPRQPADDRTATGIAGQYGYLAVAVPGDKQPTGTLVAIFDGAVPPTPPPDPIGDLADQWSTSWSPAWLPLILLATVLGTATGLGLSHRLVRRLRAMAATVKVWSRGDLQPVVDTRGTDELSHLGADLNEMAEQLRNLLTARREIAKLEERHRVQRELHDGVKQDLLAATLHLATARTALNAAPATLLGHLDHAHESTRRAQREITAIIEQLRPPPLAPLGLPDALATLCEQFAQQAGIPVQTNLTAAVQLPADIEDALVRITQEALTNVRRHAHATRVTVALHAQADQVWLLVSDNGTGPPAATGATGLGLRSMRERAAAVGATFEIEDATPGTRIKVTVDG